MTILGDPEGRDTGFADQQIKRKSSVMRMTHFLVMVPSFVGLLFFAMFAQAGLAAVLGVSEKSVQWTFLVLAGLIGVFQYAHWRCPACRTYLGRDIDPTICSTCTAALQ